MNTNSYNNFYLVIVVKKNGKSVWKSAFAANEEEAKAIAISKVYEEARDYATKWTGAWKRSTGWDNMDAYERSAMATGYKVEHVALEK